jgi:hypothetical protein
MLEQNLTIKTYLLATLSLSSLPCQKALLAYLSDAAAAIRTFNIIKSYSIVIGW